jgi:hypothetical protein
MKRFLTTLVLLPFVMGGLATGASANDSNDNPYGWSISNSFTNALSNTGAFVPGVITLKLWFVCSSPLNPPEGFLGGPGGMSAAEISFVSKNPANLLLAATAKNGYLNAGTGANFLLAVGGCPQAQNAAGNPPNVPVNAMDLLVLSNAPGQYGLVPSPQGIKGTVDCAPAPSLYDIQWIGFSNDGTAPQSKNWDKCALKPIIVSVEQTSWGNIKATYR